jgi:hypothetical protein
VEGMQKVLSFLEFSVYSSYMFSVSFAFLELQAGKKRGGIDEARSSGVRRGKRIEGAEVSGDEDTGAGEADSGRGRRRPAKCFLFFSFSFSFC